MDVTSAVILTMLCMAGLMIGVVRCYLALLNYGRPKMVENRKEE